MVKIAPFWNAGQRGVVLGFLLVLLAMLGWRYGRNPMEVPDPPPFDAPRGGELAGGIDPNVADVFQLALLPEIGEKRAADIIAFRESRRSGHLGQPLFAKPEDLLMIKGVGLAMIEQWRPYLVFPSTRPTTVPAEE